MTNKLYLKSFGSSSELGFLNGERNFYGVDRERNEEFAKKYYRESAQKGHAGSQYMYGYILTRGIAGNVNVKRGVKYIRKAARQNYVPAVMETAKNYYYGFGVKRSGRKAMSFWKKGADLGSGEANYYLGLCYYKGEFVKKNKLAAEKYFSIAKENGINLSY